jgi:hypothetical protein
VVQALTETTGPKCRIARDSCLSQGHSPDTAGWNQDTAQTVFCFGIDWVSASRPKLALTFDRAVLTV